jgi:curved DNA-binding protein CbpA
MKAYRKAALKWHPDRQQIDAEGFDALKNSSKEATVSVRAKHILERALPGK